MTVEDNNGTTSEPHRFLLISVPRTASNLLLKVLDIYNQPNVLTNPRAGYFFYEAFTTTAKDGLLQKSLDQWTDSEKTRIAKLLQEGFDNLEEYSARAKKEGKIMFAKEHAFWFVNPAAFHKKLGGSGSGSSAANGSSDPFETLRVPVPDSYGHTRSFSPSNETVLSDEYLRTWRLGFIIRHPALAWPSLYRALRKMSQVAPIDDDDIKGVSFTNMSLRWTRMLYDWHQEQPDGSTRPLIIDAEDVIHNPAAVIQFCELAGFDKSRVQFEWGNKPASNGVANFEPVSNNHVTNETAAQDNWHQKAAAIMLQTLQDSKGIIKDKTPATVDIGVEAEKWRAEFGDEVAAEIEKAVRDSMEDYEYLKARRVTGN